LFEPLELLPAPVLPALLPSLPLPHLLLLPLTLLLTAPHQSFLRRPYLLLPLLLRPLNQLLSIATTLTSIYSLCDTLSRLDVLDEPLLLIPAEGVPLGDDLRGELPDCEPRVLRFELLASETRIDRLKLGVEEVAA
jgi:hypothetical protein